MKLVHMAFLTVESGKADKDVYIIVVADHFTRYAQACITPTQTARVVVQTWWDKFFVHYGLPEQILSDQGRNFESNVIAKLWQVSKIKMSRLCVYIGTCLQLHYLKCSRIQPILPNVGKTSMLKLVFEPLTS